MPTGGSCVLLFYYRLRMPTGGSCVLELVCSYRKRQWQTHTTYELYVCVRVYGCVLLFRRIDGRLRTIFLIRYVVCAFVSALELYSTYGGQSGSRAKYFVFIRTMNVRYAYAGSDDWKKRILAFTAFQYLKRISRQSDACNNHKGNAFTPYK